MLDYKENCKGGVCVEGGVPLKTEKPALCWCLMCKRSLTALLAAGRASAFRLRLAGTFPVWAAGPTAGSMFSGDQIFLCSRNGPAWVFAFQASSIQHLDDKKAERMSGAAHEGIGQIAGLACCEEPRAVPVRGWAPQT